MTTSHVNSYNKMELMIVQLGIDFVKDNLVESESFSIKQNKSNEYEVFMESDIENPVAVFPDLNRANMFVLGTCLVKIL